MAVRLYHTHVSPALDLIDYDSQPERPRDYYEQEYGHHFDREELEIMLNVRDGLECLLAALPFRRIRTSSEIKSVSRRICDSAMSIDGRLRSRD